MKKILLFIALLFTALPLSAQIFGPGEKTFEAFLEFTSRVHKYGIEEKILIADAEAPEYVPLLPYMFFEKGQAEISDEYKLYTAVSRKNFNPYRPGFNELAMHRNILNIVAYRMKNNPDAKIKIKGYTSPDEEIPGLGMRRAIAAADYLTSVWGIDAARVSFDGGNLPPEPSTAPNNTEQAAEDNRRVEFSSDTPEILEPWHKNGYQLWQAQFRFSFNEELLKDKDLQSRGHMYVMVDDSIVGSSPAFKKGPGTYNSAIPEQVMAAFEDKNELKVQLMLVGKKNKRYFSDIIPVPITRLTKEENITVDEALLSLLPSPNGEILTPENKSFIDRFFIDYAAGYSDIEIIPHFDRLDMPKPSQAGYNRYEGAPDPDYGRQADSIQALRIDSINTGLQTQAKKRAEELKAYFSEKSAGNIEARISSPDEDKDRFSQNRSAARFYNRAIIIKMKK